MNRRLKILTSQWLIRVLATAALFYISANIGYLTAIPPGDVTVIWPPSGIALALILLWGYRIWPGVWLGGFAAHTFALLTLPDPISGHLPLITGAVIGVGITLQALVGAFLISQWTGSSNPFARVADVFKFALIAVVSVLISPTVGVTSLLAANFIGPAAYLYTWAIWWLGDAAGVLIVAPLVVVLTRPFEIEITLKSIVEGSALTILLIAAASIIFFNPFDLTEDRYLFVYPIFLFILWAAFRFNQYGTMFSVVVVTAISIGATVTGQGPFALDTAEGSLLLLQGFLAVYTLTGLASGAALIERQRAEEFNRYQVLFINSRDIILVVRKRDGRILEANQAALDAYGYSREELLSLTIYGLRDQATIAQVGSQMQQAAESDLLFETIHRRKDGSTFPVEVSSRLGSVGDEEILISIIRDITRRKQTEQALREVNEQLERRVQKRTRELKRSTEELEQYAYAASHDLQEPLRMVSLYVQLLEREYQDRLDDRAREFIQYAVEGATRIQKLIGYIRDFSKIDAEGKPFAPVDMNKALDQTLRVLQVEIDRSSARIASDPLPTVPADENQMVQVFYHLIDNALKFRDEDRTLEIHVSAERRADHWLFSVRDNGIGIEQQYFDRIFGFFQRLHTRRKYSGTGTGLALAKRIVERHGGHIFVDSTPGHGSTFYFTLPDRSE